MAVNGAVNFSWLCVVSISGPPIKMKIKEGKKSVLSGVPKSLPATIKAMRLQEKARQVGFEWENKEQVWEKVEEEIGELKAEIAANHQEKMEEEFGDVEFGPSGGHDLLVISAEVFGEAWRGQLVIIFSDQFGFGAESEAPVEVGIGGHQSGVAVFGEESDARHQVKERVIRTFRRDGGEKAIAFLHRVVGPVGGWCRFFHDV